MLDPLERAELEYDLGELLRFKAQQGAATAGRVVVELRRIEAIAAERADERELMGGDVELYPERFVILRARWRTSDAPADSDGIRRITIKIPTPGSAR